MFLIGRAAWEILFNQLESTTEIWVVTRHQNEISAVVSQTSFRRGETSAGRRKMSASFSSLLESSLGQSGGGAMDGYLLFVQHLHEKKMLISKTV